MTTGFYVTKDAVLRSQSTGPAPSLSPLVFFLFVILGFLVPLSGNAQRTVVLTQNVGDAIVGLDRKDFGGPYSQGYGHDFDLGTSLSACEIITSIDLDISIQSYTANVPPGCNHPVTFYNMYYGCAPYSGAGGSCSEVNNSIDAVNFPPPGAPYSQTYNNNASNNFDFGGNFSVDIVPVFTTGCTNGQDAVNQGYVAYTYTITVTINIDNVGAPVAVAAHSDVCPGDGAIELIGSTAATGTTIDYSWTGPSGFTANGASAFTNDPAEEGTYTLIVTVDGCVSDPVDVVVEYLVFAPQVNAVDNTVCFGDNIELEVTGAGTDFAWFDPAGNPVGGNSPTLTVPAAGPGGTQIYSVTVSDANCTENLTINIDVSADLTGGITLNPTGGVCAGEPTMFTAVMTDGNPFPAGWTFDWNSGDGSGPTYSFTENTPGSYIMNVTVTNLAGCSVVLSEGFDVTGSGGIAGEIITNTTTGVCADDVIEFTARMTDGSPFPAGWTFDWNSGDGAGPTYSFTENTPGAYTMEVMVTSPSGCSSLLSEPFTVFERPSVSIDPAGATICPDGSIVLTANASGGAGGYDYLWNLDAAQTNSTLTIDVNSANTQGLFVDVTDVNGCMAFSSTVDVTILPGLPAVTFGACGTGSESEVTFSWNDVGQTAFELYLTVDGGAEQTISTNYTNLSFTATGLAPGASATLRVIPVTISNGVTCFGPEESQTCATDNASCDNPGWLFTAIDPICLTADGQAFDLNINTTAAGTIVLNSTDLSLTNQSNGPGGITTISLPALPGISSSGVYMVTASFALPDGSCPFDTTFNIPVVTPADPEISTPLASICSAQETVRFSLVNGYDPNANYTITVDNPGGSFIVLEDAPNQVFDISFSEFRTYQVTVTTTTTGNNACTESFTLPFTLTQPPARPVLSCSETGIDSVAFSWPDVGADGYTVDQITVPPGGATEQTGTGFIVRGLVAGDAVTIAVTANTAGCPSVISDTITCVAQSCPSVMPQITTPVDTFCSDGSDALVNLTVDVPAGGSIVWSGPGVTGSQFDPGAIGVGEHEIMVVYTDGACSYPATFQLVVVDPPSGTVNIVSDTTCQGETATVTFAGANLDNATFEWLLPAASTVVSGNTNGPGPLEINFSGLGNQFAELVITGPFCEIDTLRDSVFVATPLVAVALDCANVTIDQVGFSWTHPNATDFSVTIIDQPAGATISQTNNSLLATGLTNGESVTIEVTPLSDNACPDGPPTRLTCTAVSCPAISFGIDQVGPFCSGAEVDIQLSTTVAGSDGSGIITYADSTFSTGGNFNSTGLAPGLYTVTAVFEEGGCAFPASVTIEIGDLPDPSFTLPSGPVCIDEVVGADAGAAMVGWSYEWRITDVAASVAETSATTRFISWPTAGTKEVILIVTDQNGCEDQSTETIEVVAPLTAPVVSCSNTTFTSVEFDWNAEVGVDSFQVTVNGGAPFFQDSTNLFLDGFSDGEMVRIFVSALSSGPCGNGPVGIGDCTTDSCPTITVTPPANQTFCLGDMNNTLTLIAAQNGAGGAGQFTFGGPGVSESAGVYSFDADAAGIGSHIITAEYNESVCSGMATFEFTVAAPPTSDFTLNGSTTNLTVCEGELFTLAYNGDLPEASNGTFNWDFSPAVGAADGGYESYALSYPIAGDYVISLFLTGNGCTSTTSQLNVTVEASLNAPVITCGASTFSSVEFIWNTEAGVDNFEVTINGGIPFFQDSTSLIISGLSATEEVNIEVIAFGSGACGNSLVGTGNCQTDSCPVITVTPPANQAFCPGEIIPLAATQTGAPGSGLFTFSGPGVTENAGVYSFSANSAGSGVHTITVIYEESVCSGMSTFEFTVGTPPTSDFTLNGSATNLTVCEGELFNLAYSGDLPEANNGTFNWDFSPAVGATDGGYESYNLNYPSAGSYVISLTVIESGCESEVTRLNVTVEDQLSAPVISCTEATLSSVTFGWASVAGAEGYLLSDGTVLGANELSYTITGLTPGESVALTLIATSSSACGNSVPSAMINCQADFEGCSTGATFTAFCDDNNPNTVNDNVTLLLRDSSVCVPCMGAPCDFFIELDADLTISVGDSVRLRIVANALVDSVVWEDVPGLSCLNCEEPFAKPTETTTYEITAFDENGCESTANITIIVDERRKIYIPNVFSPNGDGINDFFEIQGGPDIRVVSRFDVYDRWGAVLFNSVDQPLNSLDGRWLGDHRGQPVTAGVYIYVAVIEFFDGHVEKLSGEVLVMK